MRDAGDDLHTDVPESSNNAGDDGCASREILLGSEGHRRRCCIGCFDTARAYGEFCARFQLTEDLTTFLKEKIIAELGLFMGELNDAHTRRRIRHNLTVFLERIQRVKRFTVVCDETNNPSEAIERNECNVKVDIKLRGRRTPIFWDLTMAPAKP